MFPISSTRLGILILMQPIGPSPNPYGEHARSLFHPYIDPPLCAQKQQQGCCINTLSSDDYSNPLRQQPTQRKELIENHTSNLCPHFSTLFLPCPYRITSQGADKRSPRIRLQQHISRLQVTGDVVASIHVALFLVRSSRTSTRVRACCFLLQHSQPIQ